MSDFNTVSTKLLLKKDPEKAEKFKRFFKTGKGEYGEGDKFIGISVPDTRAIAKEFILLDFEDIHRLLGSEFHEMRMCGALILVEKYAKSKLEVEKQEIVDFYLAHRKSFNNWDLVDLSCYKLLGKHLLKKTDRKVLYDLAHSGHLWSERIAMVSTYAFIREHQFDDTLKLAEHFLNHKHDLMHKAVGWMLKELGKRNREVEDRFLDKFSILMPRTMLRIAIEKHDNAKKAHYLRQKA
jgi:3-methyladenine DNA glycosylase AlkD